jgi:hypothetical protein
MLRTCLSRVVVEENKCMLHWWNVRSLHAQHAVLSFSQRTWLITFVLADDRFVRY